MIPIRVAIVTDCDVSLKLAGGTIDPKDEETKQKIERIKSYHDREHIKTFVAPNWTFEYSVAMSCLGKDLLRAVLEAGKVSNSDGRPLTRDKIKEVDAEIDKDPMAKCTGHEFAYHVYQTMMLDRGISKAITAQCLAAELWKKIVDGPGLDGDEMFAADLFRFTINAERRGALQSLIVSDGKLKYIVDAIKYVTETEGE